jgi:hypothetical protein
MKRRIAFTALLIFTFSALVSCYAPPKPSPKEEAVLNSLNMLQQGYGRRISVDEFARLLAAASDTIDELNKSGRGNSCFLNAAKRCYSSYEISQKAWKLKEEASDENRRVDLETTLSFTIGFASISLAKANECFLRK